MQDAELFIGLLLAVSVLAAIARLVDVPYPVVGLAGGLVLGAIPGLPAPHLPPDLVFLLFLPPLLYSAAFLTDPDELRDEALSITLLAIGLVVVTMLAVAAVAHALLDVGWAVAFVLGAILSPTDPVAATSVLSRLGAPGRVVAVLEGEALLNDGTGLTAYKVALGAVGGSFALGATVGDFLLISLGGLAVGAAIGQLSAQIRRRVDLPDVETTISLLTPFAAYIPAERIGVSGVLAAVAAGLVVGARSTELSAPSTRMRTRAFWEVLAFILESSLFLLVGLQVPEVLGGIDVGAGRLVADIAALTATLVVVRVPYVWLVRRRVPRPERAVQAVSGIRGAVSVAAALALPLDVPRHDLLIAVTAGVVLATLAPPSLGLGALAMRLGLVEPDSERREEVRARLAVTRAAIACIARAGERDELPERALANLRERYEMRAERLERRLEADDGDAGSVERSPELRELRRQIIAAQRDALRDLRRERSVDASLSARIESDLDLEETRLGA